MAQEIDFDVVALVIEDLPRLVREKRQRRGLSLRATAREAGVHMTTLVRLEDGVDVRVSHVIAMLRWLG